MTPTATVPYFRALRAERIRTRGSAPSRFVGFGLAVCAVQALGWWFVATVPVRGWSDLLGWQTVHATGLLAPVSALLGGLVVGREKAARGGGTATRPLRPSTALSARLTVAALQLVAFHAAVTLPLLLVGLAHGLTDPPVARLVTLWLVLSCGALLPGVLGYALAQRAGLLVAVGAGLAWQIGGTLAAEAPSWWLQPWTWAVRAAMPVLGVHANGLRLSPGDPLLGADPWAPALACAALALAVGAALATRATPESGVRPRRRRSGASSPEESGGGVPLPAHPHHGTAGVGAVHLEPVAGGRRRGLAASATAMRGTGLLTLVAATVVLVALVGAIWDAAYVAGLLTWLVVPVGCAVLACLVGIAHGDVWRALVLRAQPVALAGAVGALALGALTVVVAASGAVIAATGDRPAPDASPSSFLLLLWCVGAAALLVDLWLVTRFGPGVVIGATLLLLVVSLVLGGTWVAQGPAWIAGFFAWPSSAVAPDRVPVAVGACLVVALAAGAAWVRALRRVAAR